MGADQRWPTVTLTPRATLPRHTPCAVCGLDVEITRGILLHVLTQSEYCQ